LENVKSGKSVDFKVEDNAYGILSAPQTVSVASDESKDLTFSTSSTGNWYDFTVSVSGDCAVSRRFMGRMETGKDTISDPAMSKAPVKRWLESHLLEHSTEAHPRVPDHLRTIRHVETKAAAYDKDARFFPLSHSEF
jgi:hypothetical protein